MQSSPNGIAHLDATQSLPVVRVLVVEDNVDSAESMASLLRMSGHNALTARSGEEALALVDDFRPDAVILDVCMPGLSGCETAVLFRDHPSMNGVPLIAVSGHSSEQADKRFGNTGVFDHYFIKPVDPKVILALVASVTMQSCQG